MKIRVRKRNGKSENLNLDKINQYIERAVSGIADVSVSDIAIGSRISFYDGITTDEICNALILSAQQLIETEPNYSLAAGRLLLHKLYKEVFKESVDSDVFDYQYRQSFIKNIKKLVKEERLDKRLLTFDLKELASYLSLDRDNLFEYAGIRTLYDRYLIKHNSVNMESPQAFWMRVAMGVSLNEPNPTEAAKTVYDAMSSFHYCHSTPTLFNSGTTHPQLSSCYLSTIDDSLDGIYGTMHEQARLSKYAGGLGVDGSYIRSTNAGIVGTAGKSNGIVPWIKVFNDTLIAVNQGGKRPGAGCFYLEVTHPDIEDFLELRKNTGDERRRCHDTHTAVWIPDMFMRAVENNEDWYLFNPSDTPDLHDLYGDAFERRVLEYRDMISNGAKIIHKVVSAKELWKKILINLKTNSHPWVTFKDTANERYTDKHAGIVHNSNLCCITKDQLVACHRGLVSIDELYKTQESVKVVGINGISDASVMLLPRPNAPIVKICTTEGYTHKVTPDHKVWVLNKGWVEAQDLNSGDRLLIQQQEGMFGTNHDPDLAFLLGITTGDGTFGGTVCIDIWPHEYFIIPQIEDMVKRVIQRYSDDVHIDKQAIHEPKFSYSDKKARLSSSILTAIFDTVCGFNKQTKLVVPNWILQADRETMSKYLSGLYFTDGTTQGGEVTVSSLASVSKELLSTVQIMLANFGIKSTICRLHDEGLRLLPDGNGNLKEYFCNETNRLLVTSIRGNQTLESITNIGKYRNNTKFLDNLQKDGYVQKLYCTFDKLEQLPNEDAYCLTVYNDNHSWTVNGMITKNTEIIRHTIPNKYHEGKLIELGETAVCNLASVNLLLMVLDGKVNYHLLEEVVRTSVRALDNVIDINYYPVESAKVSNFRYRPIGLGVMGFQSMLYQLGIMYDSEEAIKFSNELFQRISYYAIDESANLARERGCYPKFDGSLWSQGILPMDTATFPFALDDTLDWDRLREKVKGGMRNGSLLAVAPTATISYIQGCSQSIEPDYSVLWVYSNLSGEFTMVNKFFVEEAKKHGIWCDALLQAVKQCDGDLSKINGELPNDIKEKFKHVFNLDFDKIIDCNAARQVWIDQSQSFNLYTDSPSLKYLSDMYFRCWKNGLKTTYYVRSKAASKIEKSTTEVITEPKVCSIDNPDCESCQ